MRSRSHQGYTTVKVIPRSNCMSLTFYRQAGSGLRQKGIVVVSFVCFKGWECTAVREYYLLCEQCSLYSSRYCVIYFIIFFNSRVRSVTTASQLHSKIYTIIELFLTIDIIIVRMHGTYSWVFQHMYMRQTILYTFSFTSRSYSTA